MLRASSLEEFLVDRQTKHMNIAADELAEAAHEKSELRLRCA